MMNSYQLYYFASCPFCIKAIVQLKLLGVSLPLRNIKKDNRFKRELIAGGGKKQVPCLRIENKDHEVRWLYESSDIVEYFRANPIVTP